ncbi:AEC family transporter [Marinobacter lutaoensis]|jgi:predicted permease|uniref:Transporter n=1 Tax=Marinobacter lutaoensis TaxID=135739 RepID=A0A1V2DR61_9GAMM|nr:AEC family transporter [Marinobacter lutaoensis]MBE03316.1 AEC family transporter [Marinobacter sp.]MBI42852.1 AEC family transporter [Oceanospirillales bacterium]NVD34836.1 AEC family transporter [Marinobacter lutaoensis]ONF43142.1 transporter [Marinobacter lutaoensis]|tara:strand:- start:10019 stop:10936 length:918 start_codon:yes stop_codon:yes gene_type:complete
MAAALALFVKLIPLYLTVALGWVAGRYLEASGRQLAGIMLYIVTPSVVFSGVMAAPLSPEVVLLPFLTFGLSCVLGISQLKLARKVVTDGSANIIPLCVGSGNTGYFGVPVALLLFGEEGLGLYIVCMLGTTLFENSVGFYLAARGRYDLRDALLRVLKLPSVYAFLAAVALNLSGFRIPDVFVPLFDNLRGAYSVLGMMIIGMSITSFRGLAGNLRFTGLAFFGKFVVWPLVATLFWWLDAHILGIYDTAVHQAMFLIAITPIAANTVVIATLLDTAPRQAAGTVLLTTLFALVFIPVMISLAF